MNISNLEKVIHLVGRIVPHGVQLLGTCFLLNKKGLFATAAHVTGNDETNLVLVTSETTNLSTYQDTSDSRVKTFPLKIYRTNPVHDVCILKFEGDALSNINIGNTDNVEVTEGLAIVGFPHCTDGRKVLTYQTTVVGAKVLIEASGIKTKHLVVNVQTRPGQSGSPIFRISDTRLVAMVLGSYAPGGMGGILLGGIDPHTLHQTTHAISAEYILEMI